MSAPDHPQALAERLEELLGELDDIAARAERDSGLPSQRLLWIAWGAGVCVGLLLSWLWPMGFAVVGP